jgi:hypothetical protein
VPSVRITDGERDLQILPCQYENPALVSAGRHATGRCVFVVDETTISDLSQRPIVEVYDNDTNISIYRRRPPSKIVRKRIFRLETQLFPLWQLDDAIGSEFQYFHKGVERHGRETTMQMFLLLHSDSIYLSGRVVFKAYEMYMAAGFAQTAEPFTCVAVLRDPYVELAERLLTLKHVRKFGNALLGERDLMTFGETIAFAERLANDEKQLRRAFGAMPVDVIRTLANPLASQLTAPTADSQAPSKRALATALETLSRFAIVGMREQENDFLEELAQLVGVSAASLPSLPQFPHVTEFADHLRRVPETEVLIGEDLEIYYHVKSVHEHVHEELANPHAAVASPPRP